MILLGLLYSYVRSSQGLNLSEKEFFSHDIWTSLPMISLGIGALKLRLGAVLREQIILAFPKLIRELEVGIDECRNQLTKLGRGCTNDSGGATILPYAY